MTHELGLNDILVNFNVARFVVSRVDNFSVPSMTKNHVYASFEFDDTWQGLTPTAIFSKGDFVQHMPLDDNNVTYVPNELLADAGTIIVSVYAGSLRTVNEAHIQVIQSGYKDETQPPPLIPFHTYVKTPNNSVPLIRRENGVFQYQDSENNWHNLEEIQVDEHTLIFDPQGQLTVNTTDDFEGDNSLPITAGGVHTIVGNINELLSKV